MRGLVVPWAVFAPVRSGDFVPGIVERTGRREDLHGDTRHTAAAFVGTLDD